MSTPSAPYSSRTDAILYQVIVPIEASGEATRDDYDIDAIADKVLGGYSDGYAQQVSAERFWDIVQEHAR